MKVFQQGDKVMLDLGGRIRDVLLSCGEAERFAEALERGANGAELAPGELIRGETWNIVVKSFDRRVGIRFIPPDCGYPERVPLPVGAARALARRVREEASWAQYGLRFVGPTRASNVG